jgi:putative copper resistance protein D
MKELYLTSVFLHIVAAMLWVGGNLFIIVVLVPAIKDHSDRAQLFKLTGLKFRTAGYIALAVLFLTGIFNMYYRGVDFTWESLTQHAIGELGLYKIGLFLLIVFFSGLHDYLTGKKAVQKRIQDPNSPEIPKIRQQARLLGRINFLISLILVSLGIVMVRGWF